MIKINLIIILSLSLFVSIIVINSFADSKDYIEMSNSLVNAERAFARAALANGIRDAFLTYLADEAIIFQPDIIEGKTWYANRDSIAGILSWRPIYADVSLAGDLGYTTGPWEYRKEKMEDDPVAFGHYVSVWKKQADGEWRVAIDVGIGYAGPDTTVSELVLAADKAGAAKPLQDAEVEDLQQSLLEADLTFAKSSEANGFDQAFLACSTENVRLYRDNNFPLTGRDASVKLLAEQSAKLTWQPRAAVVARGGDLGYTYGHSTFVSDNPGSEPKQDAYFRIWKKQVGHEWKVVLDLKSPLPSDNP